jgi:hypothetical protein
MLDGVHGNLIWPWREQDVANSIATSGKTLAVNCLRCISETKFATWVANGQLLCGNATASGITLSTRQAKCAKAKQKRRRGRAGRRYSLEAAAGTRCLENA